MEERAVQGMRHISGLFQQYGKKVKFSAGQQIFLKDSTADAIYLLEEGKVRAYLLYPDGAERTLCFVERGNLVGEEAVAQPPVRIVCADAVTELLTYSLTARQLFEACFRERESLPELMALFMKKIELLSGWIFYAQFTQNSAKLACFLYSNSRTSKTVSYTQEQIAAVTGMSRVSVSSGLRDLAEHGIVRAGYRFTQVLDRPALRERFGNQEFY